MKRNIIFCALFLFSCSYGERSSWNGGADAENVYQEQRQEEIEGQVNDQLPQPGGPQTERPQPF